MEQKAYNLNKIQDISGGDQDFIKDMIATFIENVSDAVEKIQTLKSIEDWKTIGEISHKLASNFAYMGADSLHDIAGSIEKSVIIESDLAGIAEKTDKLCNGTIVLLNQMKEDFSYLQK
jgi:HPt (histidine-containing phosphotransfer) domain-containing protein